MIKGRKTVTLRKPVGLTRHSGILFFLMGTPLLIKHFTILSSADNDNSLCDRSG